jgi:hypothetical protein
MDRSKLRKLLKARLAKRAVEHDVSLWPTNRQQFNLDRRFDPDRAQTFRNIAVGTGVLAGGTGIGIATHRLIPIAKEISKNIGRASKNIGKATRKVSAKVDEVDLKGTSESVKKAAASMAEASDEAKRNLPSSLWKRAKKRLFGEQKLILEDQKFGVVLLGIPSDFVKAEELLAQKLGRKVPNLFQPHQPQVRSPLSGPIPKYPSSPNPNPNASNQVGPSLQEILAELMKRNKASTQLG